MVLDDGRLEARDRFAQLLGVASGAGLASAELRVHPKDLDLAVREVGQIAFPVTARQARDLIAVARPARYGLRDDTLLDRRVRDTWEVPKSRVKIDKRRWNKTLGPVLKGLGGALGVPDGCRLKAELHSMLVYGPGQFFVPHQDSEKVDGMVASLVVTLPSAFEGGELVVEDGGKGATYGSDGRRLSLVAFYADRRHEVLPVRSGYRVVLTYNLIMSGQTTSEPEPADDAVEDLAAALDEHFTTPPTLPEWRFRHRPEPVPPNRLIYLLDHDYTERGLSWSRTKGIDSRRLAVLRSAAERTDCELTLALVDVHETWNAFDDGDHWEDGHGRSAGRGRRPSEPDDYHLDDLIASEIAIVVWLDGSAAHRGSSPVEDFEVCASTPSSELRPYESEYEPYMGNYGNTMDRWYRRGAVVLWPRSREFEVRSRDSPEWALHQMIDRIDAGDIDEVRLLVSRTEPFWRDVVRRSDEAALLGHALRVAHGITDERRAADLLGPFPLESLTTEDIPYLVKVCDRYGERWTNALIEQWSPSQRHWARRGERVAWIETLAELAARCLADADADTGATVARLLARDSWNWLNHQLDRVEQITRPTQRLAASMELVGATTSLVRSVDLIDDDLLRDRVLTRLTGGEEPPLDLLLGVLHSVAEKAPAEDPSPMTSAIAERCVVVLDDRLARSERAPGDWSISLPTGCDCELCQHLAGFLQDPTDQVLEWPLAKQRRQHVHDRIDSAELPVTHQTRRTGRPYTLVLTKTDRLFELEAAARSQAEIDLSWIRNHLKLAR